MIEQIVFRSPEAKDGARVNRLIARCPPLDTNSLYCNLLQCTHFAATSLIATRASEAAGFASGYILPEQPDTLFVWQVAVAPDCRGQGLAGRMLARLLDAPACRSANALETSITRANTASWRTFRALATSLGTRLTYAPWLSKREHFECQHDAEYLVHIGPISRQNEHPPIEEYVHERI